MLNKNVTNVLQEVQKITNSIILKYPQTIANSAAGDILISMNISALDSEEFEDIGIYNLSEFLNTFKLFDENRKVSINESVIFVSDDNTKVEYISNNINLLKEFDKPASIFETTEAVPKVAEFALTSKDISKVNQASKVFADLEDVQITSKDGEIQVSLSASNKFNAQSNKFSLQKEAQTSKEFTVAIPVENFNNLPSSDYTVEVKYNSSKNAYRVLFTSTELDDFKVLMNVKK